MSDICKFCGTEPNDSCPGICENFNAARHCAWFSTERLKIIEASGAIEAAIAQEREACAKTVERVAWSSPSADAEYAMRQVAKVAAADIRARNPSPPQREDE